MCVLRVCFTEPTDRQRITEIMAKSISLIDGLFRKYTADPKSSAPFFSDHVLSTIPAIYFTREFNLKNVSTFDHVTANSDGQHLSVVRESLPVQLNGHLDVVETHLWMHIYRKFAFFYSGVKKIVDLNARIFRLAEKVEGVQRKVNTVKQNHVYDGIRCMILERRLKRLKSMRAVLTGANRARAAGRQLYQLASFNDYFGVLELTRRLEDLTMSRFKDIACIDVVNNKCKDVRALSVHAISQRFEYYALSWNPDTVHGDEDIRTKLTPYLNSLLTPGFLLEIMQSYRIRLEEEILNLTRTAISMYFLKKTEGDIASSCPVRTVGNDRSNEDNIDHLRLLNFESFVSFLELMIEHLSVLILRASGVVEVVRCHLDTLVEDIAISWQQKGTPKPLYTKIMEHTYGALDFVCEKAQRTVHDLLRARKEQHLHLSLFEAEELWKVNSDFIALCEKKSRTHSYVLRNTLVRQTKSLYERMSDKHVAQLVNSLDSEKWKDCDISISMQTFMTGLANGQVVLPVSGFENTDSNPDVPRNKNLSFSGESFHLVNSAVVMLKFIADYLSFVNCFPIFANDVQQAVLSLFRTFNQRSRQLILNGGAFSSGVVRSITVKHLALNSQCLGLLILLVPIIRSHLSQFMQDKHHIFFCDLESLIDMMNEHRDLIFSKFVDIILTRVLNASKISREASSTCFNQADVVQASSYMKSIVCDLKAMHRVLYELLPTAQLQDIFSRIMGKFVFLLIT